MNVPLELARNRAGRRSWERSESIERESETLNEMIGHLLTLTRLESGTRRPAATDVDSRQTLYATLPTTLTLKPKAGNRSVQIVSSDDHNRGHRGVAPQRHRECRRNAVRYTAEGRA